MSVAVHPATPDRWNDLVAAFGSRGADASWCVAMFAAAGFIEIARTSPTRPVMRLKF